MQLIESAQESIKVLSGNVSYWASLSLPTITTAINEFDLELMAKIDEIYTRNPFFAPVG